MRAISHAGELLGNQVRSDVLDRSYVQAAIADILRVLVPEYRLPTNYYAEVIALNGDKGYVLRSNLEWLKINELYHQRVPPSQSSITGPYLLTHIFDVRKEICIVGAGQKDLWLPAAHSAVLQSRVSTLAERIARRKSEVDYFQTITFEGRSFSTAMRSGAMTPDDLLKVLEAQNTRDFKRWLAQQNPDGSLVGEYNRALGTDDRAPWRGVGAVHLGRVCCLVRLPRRVAA